MVRRIAARIEDGRIIPEEPLPEPGEVRSVTILLEVNGPPPTAEGDVDPVARRAAKAAAMAQLVGILKDAGDPDELQEECRRVL